MARGTLKPGAIDAVRMTIAELELEERLARRRMDSAAVGLELAQRSKEGDLASREFLADFQRTRWELWSAALNAARRKLGRHEEAAAESMLEELEALGIGELEAIEGGGNGSAE